MKIDKKIITVCIAASVIFVLGAVALILFFGTDGKLELKGEDSVAVSVFEEYTDEGFSARHLWMDISSHVTAESDVDENKTGEYFVKYELNYHGKTFEVTRKVTVEDTEPPEIILKGDETVSVSSMELYSEPGYSAEDNYDGDITNKVTTERTDKEEEGICIITYSAADSSGNKTSAERKVIVSDKTPPVLSLNGQSEVTVSTPQYNDPGCSAVDDVDGDISGRVQVETDYKSGVEGEFTFTYTVSDSAGNTVSAVRKVKVADTVAPVITLRGDKTVYVGLGESFSDPGASASDAFDGDVTQRIAVMSSPDTSKKGTYDVQYYVEDAKGNNSSATRKVVVFRRPKIIDAPYISQNSGYPNGCESVSTVMALQYAGINISVDTFIDSYLNMAAKPTIGGSGPDVDAAYGGDPRTRDGWGCNSPVIVNALNKFVDKNQYNISHAYGRSMDELCSTYIDNGVPVIIWATVDMMDSSASRYYVNWTTANGKVVTYNRKLHCVLLVGYDDDSYYFNDPKSTGKGTKYIGYSKASVNKAYGLMNSQSIAISKK